jgi:hypothetical protein
MIHRSKQNTFPGVLFFINTFPLWSITSNRPGDATNADVLKSNGAARMMPLEGEEEESMV